MDFDRKLQLRVGVFTLVVLIAAAAVILTMSRGGGIFAPRYTLYAEFDNIEGLLVNDPVHLAGHNVGRVDAIEFVSLEDRKAIRVALDLHSGVQERIREGSLASIHMHNLLGDMYVSVSLGRASAEPLADGATLAAVDPTSFLALADQAAELVDNLVSISESASHVVGEFDESMGTRSIAETLGSLRRIVDRIETGNGLLHAAIYDRSGAQALREFDGAAGDLRKLVGEVRTGPGPLHALIYGDGEGSSSPLARMGDAATRLEAVLDKVDRGDGTLGLLVNDPSLYEETRLLVRGAQDSRLLRTLIDYVRPEDEN